MLKGYVGKRVLSLLCIYFTPRNLSTCVYGEICPFRNNTIETT